MRRWNGGLIIWMMVSLVCTGVAWAGPSGMFFKATPAGCFINGEKDAWKPLNTPSISVRSGMQFKTDASGWGTFAFSYGTLVLKPDSAIRFDDQGLFLTTGSFKAFIRRSPTGYRFKVPGAMMAVRGTIFTAGADGSLAVEAGAVARTDSSGNQQDVGAGESVGKAPGQESLPGGMAQLDAALTAEHDGDPALAAQAFLSVVANPAFANLADFRGRILQDAIREIGRAQLPASHPLVREASAQLRSLGESWFSLLENLLSDGENKIITHLLAIESALRPGKQSTPRDELVRALAAELNGDDQAMEKAFQSLRNAAVSARINQMGAFWANSWTYLQVLQEPQKVPPARITAMVSPRGLYKLSPVVIRKRMALASKLPASILEAQGLYYLLRGYLADGNREKALQMMAFFRANYAGSPWLSRAENLLARKPEAQPEAVTNAESQSSLGAATAKSGATAPKGITSQAAASDASRKGKKNGSPVSPAAGGSTASSTTTGVTAQAADTLDQSF